MDRCLNLTLANPPSQEPPQEKGRASCQFQIDAMHNDTHNHILIHICSICTNIVWKSSFSLFQELDEALKRLPMKQIVDLTGEEDSSLMSSEKKLELPEGTTVVKALV